MKKDKRKLMEDASEAWVMEDPDNRTMFNIIGDKKSNTTSCGVSGREDLIVEAIVNECLHDESIAQLVLVSAEVYLNMKDEEEIEKEHKQEEKKPKTTKKYLS